MGIQIETQADRSLLLQRSAAGMPGTVWQERPAVHHGGRDEQQMVPDADQRLGAARGLMIGLPIGAALWAGIGVAAWLAFH
jgi:hypothetical protein